MMAVVIPASAYFDEDKPWDTHLQRSVFDVPDISATNDINIVTFRVPSGTPEKTVRALTKSLPLGRTTYELIREYSNLGRIEGREDRKEFWRRYLDDGAQVLLARAKYDADVERLAEVSALLAEIAEPRLMLDALSEEPPAQPRPEYFESLLRAIRWATSPLEARDERDLLAVLRRLAGSKSADMREAAYMAAIRLPNEVALRFLEGSLAHEVDQEARRVIDETMEELD
jgi:hypothetical protein